MFLCFFQQKIVMHSNLKILLSTVIASVIIMYIH